MTNKVCCSFVRMDRVMIITASWIARPIPMEADSDGPPTSRHRFSSDFPGHTQSMPKSYGRRVKAGANVRQNGVLLTVESLNKTFIPQSQRARFFIQAPVFEKIARQLGRDRLWVQGHGRDNGRDMAGTSVKSVYSTLQQPWASHCTRISTHHVQVHQPPTSDARTHLNR